MPVSPLPLNTWPGENKGMMYWLVEKDFDIERIPEDASITIAADRHYEVFINSKHVASQRNYFNGDKYVLAQQWRRGIKEALRQGTNTIRVLVRSDAFDNKNYIHFHPFVWLNVEMHYPDGDRCLSTDTTWRLAVIETWRRLKTLQTTIAYEEVTLPVTRDAGGTGIPRGLSYRVPEALDIKRLPDLYEWTDPPKGKIVHQAGDIIAHGAWDFAASSYAFNLAEVFKNSDSGVLRGSFECAGGKRIALAISALSKCRVNFNAQEVGARDALPGRSLMRQYNYAAPLCECTTRPGSNAIEFLLAPEHRMFFKWAVQYADQPVAGLWLKVVLHGVAGEQLEWRSDAGERIIPQKITQALHDQVGSMATRPAKARWQFERDPFRCRFDGLTPASPFYALVDFHKLVKGKIALRIHAQSQGKIYLAYGFMVEHGAVDCARNGRKAVDELNVPAGESFYQAFEDRVFRYLDILGEGFEGAIEISQLAVEENVFLDGTGTFFESSDPVMEAVWSAARRTAQLCCDEIYCDNMEREHCQWISDATPNFAAGYYAFGEIAKASKVIDEWAINQRSDGQMQGYAPGCSHLVYPCAMAFYTSAVWRHFWYTGNAGMLKRLLPNISQTINFLEKHRNRQGLLENLKHVFVDWGVHIYSYRPDTPDQPVGGVITAMNAYYLGVLRKAAELAGWIGHDSLQVEYSRRADALACAMRRELYDRDKKLFRDGLNNSLAEANYSQAANTLCVLYGVLSEAEGRQVLRKAFEESTPWSDIIPASAMFCSYVGEALFNAGLDVTAYEWIRKGFGAMLRYPAGTLWETFEPYVSHCQGSSGGGILYLLSRYHAGFYPEQPGYSRIGINPHACGQKHLRARLKTQFGFIEIEWQWADESYDCRLVLPGVLSGRTIVKSAHVRLDVTYAPC